MNILLKLIQQDKINPPTFLPNNTHYLCRMGSVAYGVSTNMSDQDIYGVCIPPKEYIFPSNYIEGFDNRDLTFHQWQKHHVQDGQTQYDFSIYSIVNYFKLAMDNNPNVLDSLFVRREHILHTTELWENIRNHKGIFLHKGVTYKMRGYAFSQKAKAQNCIEYINDIRSFEDDNNIPHSTTHEDFLTGKIKLEEPLFSKYKKMWDDGLNKTSRFEQQKIYGQDNKFLYHIYRLVDQAEYILRHHDLDLQEQGRVEKMKAIRRGDISFDEITREFSEAEKRLNTLYDTSTLRKYPPTKEIRQLLITSLEHHYGSLSAVLKIEDPSSLAIKEIKGILGKFNL